MSDLNFLNKANVVYRKIPLEKDNCFTNLHQCEDIGSTHDDYENHSVNQAVKDEVRCKHVDIARSTFGNAVVGEETQFMVFVT